MSLSKYEEIAAALKKAEKNYVPMGPVSKNNPEFEIKDAYRIQLLNIEKEIESGRKITGKKIGLTSAAMQNMLEVNQPDFGHLLDSMEVINNIVPEKTVLQPKAEAEIAFFLKKDINGPNVTVEDVIEATDYVCAAIEVVGSRVADWKINIVDTVADNASSGMYVVSDKKVDPKLIDLKKIKMEFYKNGEKINEGLGTDVLGDPANCVVWLANTLCEYGVVLKKGEVVLSGALSAALAADSGDKFKAAFTELGDVIVEFE